MTSPIEELIRQQFVTLDALLLANDFKEFYWSKIGGRMSCKIIFGEQISTNALQERLDLESTQPSLYPKGGRRIEQNRSIVEFGLNMISLKPPEGILVPCKSPVQERLERYFDNSIYAVFTVPINEKAVEKLDRIIADVKAIAEDPERAVVKRFPFREMER